MTTSFVTGAGGFIGSHLVEHLRSRGDTVISLYRTGTIPKNEGGWPCKADELPSDQDIRIAGDILDKKLIFKIFREFRPDEIYHLAGQSSPAFSWDNPALSMEINYQSSLLIIEAAKTLETTPAILLASSSSIYSESTKGVPISELDEFGPSTPYGISKLAVDQLGPIYSKAFGMRIMSVRPFFIIGPGKTGDVCSDWAQNIVKIEKGEQNTLSHGQIEGVIRDFLAIQDAIIALTTIAKNGIAGQAYNICSGFGVGLIDVLEIYKNNAKTAIHSQLDPSKLRPIEELVKVGSNKKLKGLGWERRVELDQVLMQILSYWRSKV